MYTVGKAVQIWCQIKQPGPKNELHSRYGYCEKFDESLSLRFHSDKYKLKLHQSIHFRVEKQIIYHIPHVKRRPSATDITNYNLKNPVDIVENVKNKIQKSDKYLNN